MDSSDCSVTSVHFDLGENAVKVLLAIVDSTNLMVLTIWSNILIWVVVCCRRPCISHDCAVAVLLWMQIQNIFALQQNMISKYQIPETVYTLSSLSQE
jgi:hypothetical protein